MVNHLGMVALVVQVASYTRVFLRIDMKNNKIDILRYYGYKACNAPTRWDLLLRLKHRSAHRLPLIRIIYISSTSPFREMPCASGTVHV